MSSSSALESEDLENVPLVRMEDVQPSRARCYESVRSERETLETSSINNFANECIVNNDDSFIGSMVSIQSEDVDSDNAELIMSDMSEPLDENPIDLEDKCDIKPTPFNSWPTLEILPGGVIKNAEKCDDGLLHKPAESKEMMYACAKCSQSFKYLYSLVQHVKQHEGEQKKLSQAPDLSNLLPSQKEEYICLHKGKKRIHISKKNKKKAPKKLKS